eukprot:CAMPEP_0175950142 /NCGR_PEP_ID=MMETSP0108-20121206/29444_1 /TAXON_ID=195067 ORGANISM="Goniomonas pacifica, Strain CCMP1869" /NCGR_SAMPLE_ID=MMETSP0108 /ASSEMBLY_ACC=CAM_ASM_000204 /LENGTH=46 /DNA_ID= /DNA_START= /DNA_END= /DNA_ORIENTATION=
MAGKCKLVFDEGSHYRPWSEPGLSDKVAGHAPAGRMENRAKSGEFR